jgi:L-fuconolactonase
MTPSPRRIDAHQHFWSVARGDYGWLDPQVPALAPICRDFAPGDLAPHLAAAGVSRTVLVQAAASVAETDYLLGLADAHPVIGGVVGWVDLADAASAAVLERLARHPGFKGVRPMLQDLPQDDWIVHAPHPDVMHALLRLGLRFDALVRPRHLPHLLHFVDRWPELPVVVDHAAKPPLAHDGGEGMQAWRDGLAALAARPGVHCKLSGLLTEAGGAARRGGPAARAVLRPVWDHLLAQFGSARLIWGSDWPVLHLASDYATWVALSEALLAGLPAAEQDAVRHGNALRFYDLE